LFYRYPAVNPEGLPFGMALDAYGNVWFAQHVIDEIGVLDAINGEIVEVQVPTRGSFVQWLVPDDQGRIWFAEQRGSSLGSITMILNPNMGALEFQATAGEEQREILGSGQPDAARGILGEGTQFPDLGFGFADVFGPLIACGLVVCAVLYSRNVLQVKQMVREIKG
jgi:copper transport protein